MKAHAANLQHRAVNPQTFNARFLRVDVWMVKRLPSCAKAGESARQFATPMQDPDMCRGNPFRLRHVYGEPIQLTIDEDAALALRTELERFLTQ